MWFPPNWTKDIRLQKNRGTPRRRPATRDFRPRGSHRGGPVLAVGPLFCNTSGQRCLGGVHSRHSQWKKRNKTPATGGPTSSRTRGGRVYQFMARAQLCCPGALQKFNQPCKFRTQEPGIFEVLVSFRIRAGGSVRESLRWRWRKKTWGAFSTAFRVSHPHFQFGSCKRILF